MKKAYVFLAYGFEEVEALTVVDLLRRAGIEVITVSMSTNNIISGAHKIPVVTDIKIDECVMWMQSLFREGSRGLII